MFEQASRLQLRFSSPRGELTVENLWDLPLTSVRAASLDGIAIATKKELDELQTESFVSAPRPGSALLQLKLDILKHIIKVRQTEKQEKENREALRSELHQMEALAARQEEKKREEMTPEEVQARIAALKAQGL